MSAVERLAPTFCVNVTCTFWPVRKLNTERATVGGMRSCVTYRRPYTP
jgi:hypothetical protein